MSRNRSSDIFKDLDLNIEEFEKLSKNMNNYFAYKFDKSRKELVHNRLELITKMTMLVGPQYIIAVLERIKISKQLFVLELE